MRRLGVLGGTFDPVHNGHVLLAQFARERLELDEVLFVPAANPPHKLEEPYRASAGHRWSMVQIALRGMTGLTPCRLELERAGKSYTVDTLRELDRTCPNDDLHLLIGADNLDQFRTWHAPNEILELCTLVVGSRGAERNDEQTDSDRVIRINTPVFEISSSQIRDRILREKAIRCLVPESVEKYIHQQGLYRQ